MSLYEDYVRDRHQTALDARGEAEARLVNHVGDGDPIAEWVAEVAQARAVARWWNTVVEAIEEELLEPDDALNQTRQHAHRTLTEGRIPAMGCPFKQGFALAQLEGARAFYHATAHLDELTTRTAR